jgi:hypothetical protein
MRRVLALVALVASGCTTTFYGKPKIETGPAGCRAVCEAWGMDLAGMVQMGEYSNGCICSVRGKPVAILDTAEAVLPAVAAVWTATQAQRHAAAQQHHARP